MKILVIEDDKTVGRYVKRGLVEAGCHVELVGDGSEALRLATDGRYDLLVLDLRLPGMSGIELLRTLRDREDSVPVLVLTAQDSVDFKVQALRMGADDYVTKPFSPREIVARVRTVLRRVDTPVLRPERLEYGELEIDAAAHEVRKGGSALKLTAREFDLLLFLARHPRRVFSRDQLMSRVWGYGAALDTGTVTVHIRRLREKIEPDPSRPRHLETVWGVGYRFSP